MADGDNAKSALSDKIIAEAKTSILSGKKGYQNPPEITRFKKGQSGNPKGRPRAPLPCSERSANAIALKEAERLVPLREGPDIPAIHAVFRKQLISAMGGSAYAQRHVIDRYAKAEEERRQRISEEINLWSEYVKNSRDRLSQAKAAGETVSAPLPHPDDIVIDSEKGVSFIGPATEAERAAVEELVELRHALLLQSALDRRLAENGATALRFVILLNQSLPPSVRMPDHSIEFRSRRLDGESKRKLLKETFCAWKSLGALVPRGTTFQSSTDTAKQLHTLIESLSITESNDEHHARITQVLSIIEGALKG